MLTVAVEPVSTSDPQASVSTRQARRLPAPATRDASPPTSIAVVDATAPGRCGFSPTDFAVLAAAILDDPPPVERRDEMTEPSESPRILVLGPVEIVGVDDQAQPGRRRRATELIAYLALHPGASQHQLDEALWPGVRISRNTRNPLVSRARSWLGNAAADQPYLALVGEGQQYNLHPAVSCDWHDFCVLAKRSLGSPPEPTASTTWPPPSISCVDAPSSASTQRRTAGRRRTPRT